MNDQKPQSAVENVDSSTSESVSPRVRRRKLDRPEITLSLVAMLDVSFNILIFFILTSNFAVNEGVLTSKVPGPIDDRRLATVIPSVPLKIVVGSSGVNNYPAIRIDGDTVAVHSFIELSNRLVQLQNDPTKGRNGIYNPNNPIVIQADPAVRWNYVACSFNAAVAARYSNITLAQANAVVSE